MASSLDEKARLRRSVIYLRISEGLLVFVVLVLTAYAASVLGSRAIPGYGLSWFTVIWSFVSLVVTLLAGDRLPASGKNGVTLALVLEVATAFWWLVTFALIAHGAASLSSLLTQPEYNAVDSNYVPYFEYYGIDKWKSALGATKAAAVLGAVEFVLFLATIGIALREVHSNRVGSRGQFEVSRQEAQQV